MNACRVLTLQVLKEVIVPKRLMTCAAVVFFALCLNVVFAEMDYPQELQKEVALYPNAKIAQSISASGVVMVMMEVGDKPATVLEFYKKELLANGWTILTEVKQPDHVTLMGEKGARSMLVDAALDQSGKSMVSLSLAPKQ